MENVLKTLDNGLRLITVPVGGTKAATVILFVGAGSRYESERERGIAHFLEHMFFKGGKKYDTPRKVSETIDGIGGDFNAFTGKEYAGYYVKCAGEQKEIAFDVLSDMLLATKLASADIEREKGVILEELNMYQDTPMYQIGWDFERLLFGDTPMGRDQIGVPETINSFAREDFISYRKDLYSADNTVLVVAGDVTPDEAEELAKKYFSFEPGKKLRSIADPTKYSTDAHVLVREKKTEQAHLIVGFPGFNFGHKDEFVSRLLAVILGGGMSSRMFLKIREERGLCYSISTSTDHYSDAGAISTHAGVDLKRMEEAVAAIMAEYALMRREGPTAEEITKAKNYMKGKLTLRLEDSEELASFYGAQMIIRGSVRKSEEVYCQVDAVTREDLVRVAAETLMPGKCRLALIGPFAGKEDALLQQIRD